ncbi:hypothetical protein [Tahibacter harae]|uniref:Secreted protein n=1 Tax=Tahibacter harae TaxID=2963937 RepID=A0ABT1QZN7_9GAMM|nr:hypothetical protein [Tahibacter harae]MCQ4167713.1 hypothetical protein [Tahibacter harae]
MKMMLALCLVGFLSVPALAGTRPQVDLSLSASMSPRTFGPGGRNTVELTLRNAGPDAAGTIPIRPSTLYVGGDGFYITNSPPPYEVVPPISGCSVERFVSEPLPDGNIGMAFVYYFDSIPAGEFRTCLFDVVFHSSTRTSLAGGFYAYSNVNDIDLNLENNRLDFVFVANRVPVAVAPVPAMSRLGLLGLIAGLILIFSWKVATNGGKLN